jgi:transposase-like protein
MTMATTSERRNPRLSAYPRRNVGPVRTRCARCGHDDVTVHPRRIGGGLPRLICNLCTRQRRRERLAARRRGEKAAGLVAMRRNGTGRTQ